MLAATEDAEQNVGGCRDAGSYKGRWQLQDLLNNVEDVTEVAAVGWPLQRTLNTRALEAAETLAGTRDAGRWFNARPCQMLDASSWLKSTSPCCAFSAMGTFTSP